MGGSGSVSLSSEPQHIQGYPTPGSPAIGEGGNKEGDNTKSDIWLFSVEAKLFTLWNYCNTGGDLPVGMTDRGGNKHSNMIEPLSSNPNSVSSHMDSNRISAKGVGGKGSSGSQLVGSHFPLSNGESSSGLLPSKHEINGDSRGRELGVGSSGAEEGSGMPGSNSVKSLQYHEHREGFSSSRAQELRMKYGFETEIASRVAPSTQPFEKCMMDAFPLYRSSGIPYAREPSFTNRGAEPKKNALVEGEGVPLPLHTTREQESVFYPSKISSTSRDMVNGTSASAYLDCGSSQEPYTIPFGVRYFSRLQGAWSSGGGTLTLPESLASPDTLLSPAQAALRNEKNKSRNVPNPRQTARACSRRNQRHVKHEEETSDNDEELSASFVEDLVETMESPIFDAPIPLDKMIDALYPIWEDEGLVDLARKAAARSRAKA